MTGFSPVSAIPYARFNADAQVLVCTLQKPPETAREAWQERAAAAFYFKWRDVDVRDVVRDLLANPQIRVLVFVHPPWGERGPDASVLSKFWLGTEDTRDWGIHGIHLDAVRRFVDLYDDDCGMHGPLQPFWPERLIYGNREAAATAAPGAGTTA